ncbi:DUF3987 domain-containing protein [Hyunsoonleella sp. 2307UL5-6]|uniref:DUF3987 domain-containing protein n=1 Tax=Hyunsoonleella sp. 2307UL5-6 TaxID=3384768 RepID=UPI0039BCD3EA
MQDTKKLQDSISSNIIDGLDKDYRNKKNPFPIDVFPLVIREFIQEISRTLDLNKDFLCGSALVALSTAIGNLFTLKIKEGYNQKCILWLVIIGSAGDGKSPSMKLPMKPLRNFESKEYDKYILALKQWESIPENPDPKPEFKTRILEDLTFETIGKEHKKNKNGLCIYSDEILSWLNGFGRYSGSSEENNYLSLWNGWELKINRKTNGNNVFIKHSFLNVIGGTQRARLKELFKGDRKNSGFLDRILFCYPEDVLPIKLNKKKANPIVFSNYEALFKRIFELYNDDKFLTEIEYTNEAFDRACDWENEITQKYLNDEEALISMASKLKSYCHRIALLIEVVDNISLDKNIRSVSISSLEKSILLIEYFERTAIKVKEKGDSPLEGIGTNQKKLFQKLPSKFKTQDAIEIGTSLKISDSTIKRAIKNEKLYTKAGHGNYIKKDF